MYWLAGPVLAIIGIVDALPKAPFLASDRLLERRQVDVCVPVDGNGFAQECTPIYSVNPAGQTVLEDTAGTITLPTGSSVPITATFSNGEVTTITPSDILIQTTDSSGNTIISNANSAVTIPSGLTTTLETVLPNGETTTVTPQSDSASGEVQTNVIDGQTVLSQEQGAITLPTGLTGPIETTLPDGESTTIILSGTDTSDAGTTTNSADLQTSTSNGVTIIFGNQGTLTLPTAVTTPITTTLPGGEETIITIPTTTKISTTTSDSPNLFIFPVTTSVSEPKPTPGGTVIPCDLWFFSICIQWAEFPILGWQIGLPPGVYPPGPPPPISIDPKFSVNIEIEGTLPDWPSLTIGPDNLPTYEPKPDDCEIETAEICVTSTSYDVSPSGTATITAGSSVFSTCGTVQGCNLQDKESSTATTSTAACSETAGCVSCPKWDLIHYDPAQYVDVDGAEVAAPAARAVQPGPVQTQSMTTAFKRENTLSDAASPSITSPPLALYKRTQADNRKSSSFGGCALRKAITFGNGLQPQDFNNYPAASSYFLVSQKSDIVRTTTNVQGVQQTVTTCVAGYIYSTNDYSRASRAALEAPYMSPGGGRFNADHVYEQQLFGYFFEHALSLNGAPDCTQFNDLFVDTGVLQRIFNNGANTNYPDFAAMDVHVNEKKAAYLDIRNPFPKPVLPNLANSRAPNFTSRVSQAYSLAANALQDYGVAAQFMEFDDTKALFRATHERLYQLFGEIDYDLACNHDGKAGASPTWAATYSEWMTSFLSSRNGVLTSAASSWYSIVSSQPAPPSWPYTQLTATYPAASFRMPVDAMAARLQPYDPAGNQKRQDACTRNPSETDSGSTNTATEPATTLTNLPTLTTGISTPPGSSCVSTFTQTACAPGSGGTSACVTTPACGSWTATDAPKTTSTGSPPPSDPAPRLSLAIYNNEDCTDLIDEFQIDSPTKCATHFKKNDDVQKFKCFIVEGFSSVASVQPLQLTVYKDGDCSSDDRKVYKNLASIIDERQAPFKMGSLKFNAVGT